MKQQNFNYPPLHCAFKKSKCAPIDPGLVAEPAKDDSADGIGNPDDGEEEGGPLRVNLPQDCSILTGGILLKLDTEEKEQPNKVSGAKQGNSLQWSRAYI